MFNTSQNNPNVWKNSYDRLIKDDHITKEQYDLDELEPIKQIDLASQLVLECPRNEMLELFKKLGTLKKQTTDSFYYRAHQALYVYALIVKILDTNNKEPYKFFLESEKYPALFDQFHRLSTTLVNTYAVELVCALVNSIPKDGEETIIRNLARAINLSFERTLFSNTFNEGAVLKRLLGMLNSEEAYTMFTDDDFDPNLFKKFQDITAREIVNTQAIGENLTLCPEDCVKNVKKGLDQLNLLFTDTRTCDLKTNLDQLKAYFDQATEAEKLNAKELFKGNHSFFRENQSLNNNFNRDVNFSPRP